MIVFGTPSARRVLKSTSGTPVKRRRRETWNKTITIYWWPSPFVCGIQFNFVQEFRGKTMKTHVMIASRMLLSGFVSDFVGIEILLNEIRGVDWIVLIWIAIRICDGAFAIVPEKKASEMRIFTACSFVTLKNCLDEITEGFLSWNKEMNKG